MLCHNATNKCICQLPKRTYKTNTLKDYYYTVFRSYEFEFTDVFTQTNTGVDLFHIHNNNIKYVINLEESSQWKGTITK